MNIQLIIFDFDGTLADTHRTIIATVQQTLQELRLPIASEAAITATIGLPLRDCYRHYQPELDEAGLDACEATHHRLFDINRNVLCRQSSRPACIYQDSFQYQPLYPRRLRGLRLAEALRTARARVAEEKTVLTNEIIMKIDHVALYCLDLEGMKEFFIRYFKGVSNEMYHNPKTGLKTYILSFPDSDARLELMTRPEVVDEAKTSIVRASSTCLSPSDQKKKWTVLLRS